MAGFKLQPPKRGWNYVFNNDQGTLLIDHVNICSFSDKHERPRRRGLLIEFVAADGQHRFGFDLTHKEANRLGALLQHEAQRIAEAAARFDHKEG